MNGKVARDTFLITEEQSKRLKMYTFPVYYFLIRHNFWPFLLFTKLLANLKFSIGKLFTLKILRESIQYTYTHTKIKFK